MTDTLKKAIEQLQQMPAERQEMLAQLVLHEIEQDQQWTKTTATQFDKLRGLVNDILTVDDCGDCEPLNPDQL